MSKHDLTHDEVPPSAQICKQYTQQQLMMIDVGLDMSQGQMSENVAVTLTG